jgi:hypothetical protein
MPSSLSALSLDTIPFEILEQIAFATVTTQSPSVPSSSSPSSTQSTGSEARIQADSHFTLGPPSALIPLLLTSSRFNSALSIHSNPHLYARIFCAKFDTGALEAGSRCGPSDPFRLRGAGLTGVNALNDALRRGDADPFQDTAGTTQTLSTELQLRFTALNRLRSLTAVPIHSLSQQALLETLWTVYFMLIEGGSDGKNYAQLRDYAGLHDWLKEYFFGECSPSGFLNCLERDKWPGGSEASSLAMWVFWMFSQDVDYIDPTIRAEAPRVFKLFALGAHKYPLTTLPWNTYHSRPESPSESPSTSLSRSLYSLTTPPIGPAAILSYLAVLQKTTRSTGILTDPSPIIPPSNVSLDSWSEWGAVWARSVLGNSLDSGSQPSLQLESGFDSDDEPEFRSSPSLLTSRSSSSSLCFTPGTLAGVWEGTFTFLEFHTYAMLLAGGPPSSLQRSIVVKHRQTWRVKEWYLTRSSEESLMREKERDLNEGLQRLRATARSNGSSSSLDSMSSSPSSSLSSSPVSSNHSSPFTTPSTSPPSSPRPAHTAPSTTHLHTHARLALANKIAHNLSNVASSKNTSRVFYSPEPTALSSGPAMKGYVPQGAQMTFHPNGEFLDIWDPLRRKTVRYTSTPVDYSTSSDVDVDEEVGRDGKEKVYDVIITGEGHSAWGQFQLYGRVRPSDGLLCLRKEYVDDDRGRWIYRGYVVGDKHGNVVGRWRDSISEEQSAGYEGCFVMNRR